MTGYVRSLFAVAFGSVLLAGLCAVALAEDASLCCDPMPVVDVPTCELPTCAKTMKEVEDILTELRNNVRPEETLIVFDIDNTLLKMKKDLGSDAWYNWQKVLWKASAPDSDFAVADNIDDLLKIQRLLYDVGKMEPPETGKTPNFVAWLRSAGYPS
jgi:hypothetical protein